MVAAFWFVLWERENCRSTGRDWLLASNIYVKFVTPYSISASRI